ncbi:MAG TPA: c-type cytochrome [Candidatus Aquilonibacter sp.]|nr:c-type cytochrome [Candidatus Aquilonibacter sp.]
MSRILSVVLLVALSAFGALAQDTTKPAQNPPAPLPKIPDEAKKQANPVKPSADSIAEGKKEYGTECAMCHGSNGDGKGDLASDMKLTLADFRDPASLKDITDGEIFYVIKNGRGDMPAEGDRLKTNDIWNLVNYVRSLPKKESAK